MLALYPSPVRCNRLLGGGSLRGFNVDSTEEFRYEVVQQDHRKREGEPNRSVQERPDRPKAAVWLGCFLQQEAYKRYSRSDQPAEQVKKRENLCGPEWRDAGDHSDHIRLPTPPNY
jgi:hypothetical protein